MDRRDRALRVLLLVPEYPPDTIGGGGIVFQALRREYATRYRVSVVSGSTRRFRDTPPSDMDDGVIRVAEIPLPKSLRYLATTMPPTGGGVSSLLKQVRDVDVVHAHGFGFPVVDLGIRIAARRRIPVLHTLHGFPVSQTKRGPLIKAAFIGYHDLSGAPALRRASRHSAVSQPVADFYARRYGLEVPVIPNGVELPEELPWPELEELAGDSRPLLVSVGRLEWIKGMDTLIRAISLIPDERRPRVALIGPDHGAGGDLRGLAKELSVAHLCHFMGAQPRGRVVTAYRRALACVTTSHTEAFPAVPLEAMLAGTALITSDLPSIASYATDGSDCLMFTPGDEEQLAGRIEELIGDEGRRRELVDAAVDTARRFDWGSVSRAYGDLLDDLVTSAAKPGGRRA
jgi:glycosyltransferase involved in cell wall biosynthesis